MILISKLLHEIDKGLDTFVGHGIVEGGAASTHRSVALEFDETDLLGLLEELGFQLVVLLYSEWKVHSGTVARVNRVGVVVA